MKVNKNWPKGAGPECKGPCPMDEIRPGFYRCRRCGYEVRYRLTWAVLVAWWKRKHNAQREDQRTRQQLIVACHQLIRLVHIIQHETADKPAEVTFAEKAIREAQ